MGLPKKNTNMKNYFILFICTLSLSLLWNSSLNAQCDPDVTPPTPICINGLAATLGPDGQVQIWALDFDAGSFDNCDSELEYRIELGEGSFEDGPPEDNFLIMTIPGTYIATIWTGDEAGNWDYCVTTLIIQPFADDFKVVEGRVFLDENGDCTQNPGEVGLQNWYVNLKLEDPIPGFTPNPDVYEMFTTPTGLFSFRIEDDILENLNTLVLELVTATGPSANCPTTYTIDLSTAFNSGDTLNYDLPVTLESGCHAMQVDVSVPFLRRCFENTYTIQYCNYGTLSADSAYVEVDFDPFHTILSSTLPWSSVDGTTYRFDLGEVASAECGSFQVEVNVSCDAVLGQSHCVEAHIFPDKPCPNTYAGPSIKVTGRCLGNEVEFEIENVGEGDMTEPVQYIVIEDVLMFDSGEANLNSGQSTSFTIPASGPTYRVEANQVAGHPGFSMPSAWVEGCTTGSIEEASFGFVTQFPQNDADDFISIDCQENIGAFDPNDKQAFPRGVGEEHGILQNVDIEYKIRFQNTGTDTAFNVVVLDTLSEWLDPSSVRPGASSHPYQFNMLEGNVLKFSFDNIMLPDSNVNEPASNGYFKFKVKQKNDNPLGTEILNSAAIYFDFNEPVITNTVYHTIVDHVVVVSTDDFPTKNGIAPSVYPNPAGAYLTVDLNQNESIRGQWQLMDYAGSVLQSQSFRDQVFEVNLRSLSSGFYTYRLIDEEGRLLGSGKIVKE